MVILMLLDCEVFVIIRSAKILVKYDPNTRAYFEMNMILLLPLSYGKINTYMLPLCQLAWYKHGFTIYQAVTTSAVCIGTDHQRWDGSVMTSNDLVCLLAMSRSVFDCKTVVSLVEGPQ